ncbi:hypothetical protein R1sor_009591 [Riccia sorocarpa]|uniref:F-box domain-containing protein n=1 Tax=Riccia sorocarpa TaxID=122646 RepID=A0ABD3HZ23_9MARC
METEDLDSTVWQQLPSELLEKILTKLPICALMTWCQVCKRLKTLIQSPEFARRCDSVQPLVFFHHLGSVDEMWYGVAWDDYEDVHSCSDNPVPGSYLAIPNTKTNTWEKHTLKFASGSIAVVAADQGLICFESHYSKDTLFIYNPLTRQSKELRIPVEEDDKFLRRFGCTLVGLLVDQETGNYKLVVGCLKVKFQTGEHFRIGRTLTYDSYSSTWTSTSVYPDLPVGEEGNWTRCEPGASVRCGENVYWLVEQFGLPHQAGFGFIVRFDVKAAVWTVDEPDLPYDRFMGYPNRRLTNSDFPYSLLESGGRQPPQWNFHLAPHDGVVYVILFDSLIRREAFSDPPEHYMPTKVVSQGEVWYVVFEYGGVRVDERGKKPLLVFAYSPRRNVWGWLPELDSDSSCSDVLPQGFPSFTLPKLFTLTLSLRAIV